MIKILFVGCGAVTSVMLQTLHHISQTYDLNLYYTILTRSDKFQSNLSWLNIDFESLIIEDFETFFGNINIYKETFDRVINTTNPSFNNIILSRATINHCHYMDLASNIELEDVVAGNFEQSKFDLEYKKLGLIAIINAGVSPGLTEFMIWYICQKYHITPQSIKIYLDEDFNCIKPLFSRSPRVAIQELLTLSVYIQDGHILHWGIFEDNKIYSIGHKCKDYIRVTQEELVSIKSAYTHISDLALFAWWSEIEQMRLLYNLGIFQDEIILQALIHKLPNAATRQEIKQAYNKSLIDDAGFEVTIVVDDGIQIRTIQIIFDFRSFQKIQHTPYAWATSIWYPTGVSAGWIWYIAHLAMQNHYSGIYNCLQLAQMTNHLIIDQVVQHIQKSYIDIIISSQ